MDNYINGKRFHKLKFAILNSLNTYGYSWENLRSISNDMNAKKEADKVAFAEKFARKLLDNNIINFRPIELTESYSYAFEREREIVDGLWAKDPSDRMILNNIPPAGKPPRHAQDLPFYDIALLFSLGFSMEQTHKIITEAFDGVSLNYGNFRIHVSRVFGNFFSAQEILMKPVIELIIGKIPSKFPNVPSGIKLANAFRDISNVWAHGWFSSWYDGDSILDVDFDRIWGAIDKLRVNSKNLPEIVERINLYYRRYAGATLKQWESWIIKRLTKGDIAKKLGVPYDVVSKIISKLGGIIKMQKDARRRVFIDLLALGIAPKDIYTKTFKYKSGKRSDYIPYIVNNLFSNTMSYNEIIAHDWTSQVGGWIEFYGLIRGKDY